MVDPKRFIGKTTRHAELAYERLKQGKPGDVLSESEIREAMDVGAMEWDRVRVYLQAARRRLERESVAWWVLENRVLTCVPKDREAMAVSGQVKRVQRQAERTLRRASCCHRAEMSPGDLRQFDLAVAQAAMAKASTGKRMAKAIEKSGSFDPPDVGQLAKLFGPK